MKPNLRAAMLYVLWHHQGGSSPVGQSIRAALGIGQFDHLTDEQIQLAKSVIVSEASPAPIVPEGFECVGEYRKLNNGIRSWDAVYWEKSVPLGTKLYAAAAPEVKDANI